MRILLAAFIAVPAWAQLRSVDLAFEGINCASCVESLPARIERMRGVESVKVDGAKGLLLVKLAAENRVRLEQIRDAVEQDGTKARRAAVALRGVLAEESGVWVVKMPNGAAFELSLDGAPPSAQYELKAGPAIVAGTIEPLRRDSGRLRLTVVRVEAVEEP